MSKAPSALSSRCAATCASSESRTRPSLYHSSMAMLRCMLSSMALPKYLGDENLNHHCHRHWGTSVKREGWSWLVTSSREHQTPNRVSGTGLTESPLHRIPDDICAPSSLSGQLWMPRPHRKVWRRGDSGAPAAGISASISHLPRPGAASRGIHARDSSI